MPGTSGVSLLIFLIPLCFPFFEEKKKMEARKIFTTLDLQMLLVSSYITNVCDHSRNTEKQLLKKSFLYFSHSPATFHLQIQRFCASDGSIVFAWLWLHAGQKKKKKSEDQVTLGRWEAASQIWKNFSREVYVNYILIEKMKWAYSDERGVFLFLKRGIYPIISNHSPNSAVLSDLAPRVLGREDQSRSYTVEV